MGKLLVAVCLFLEVESFAADPSVDQLRQKVQASVEKLRSPDSQQRGKAAWDLARVDVESAGMSQEVAVALIEALRDPVDYVQVLAILALGHLKSRAQDAVPELLPMLEDPTRQKRQAVLDSLRELGASRLALQAILPHFESSDPRLRSEAVWMASQLSDDAEAASAVARAVLDSSQEVSTTAVRALPSMKADAAAVIPPLIQVLQGPPSIVRHAVLVLLRNGLAWEPEAQTVIPVLRRLLQDPQPADEYDLRALLFVLEQAAKSASSATQRESGDAGTTDRIRRMTGPGASTMVEVGERLERCTSTDSGGLGMPGYSFTLSSGQNALVDSAMNVTIGPVSAPAPLMIVSGYVDRSSKVCFLMQAIQPGTTDTSFSVSGETQERQGENDVFVWKSHVLDKLHITVQGNP